MVLKVRGEASRNTGGFLKWHVFCMNVHSLMGIGAV